MVLFAGRSTAGSSPRLRSLHLLVLVGIVFGVLFRSLSGFLQRIIYPTEFLVFQDRLFASFNRVDANCSSFRRSSSGGLRHPVAVDPGFLRPGARARHGDRPGGRPSASGDRILVLVTILVSISTALVGPITFFGLLVANLAYMLIRRTARLDPAASSCSRSCAARRPARPRAGFRLRHGADHHHRIPGRDLHPFLLLRGLPDDRRERRQQVLWRYAGFGRRTFDLPAEA